MRRDGAEEDRHGALGAALGAQRRGRDEGAIPDLRGEDQEEGLVNGNIVGQFSGKIRWKYGRQMVEIGGTWWEK